MSALSAKQLQRDYNLPSIERADHQSDIGTGQVESPDKYFNAPRFGGYVYAATARAAGRVNALSVSQEEHAKLLDERAALVARLIDEGLTRREENRLEYIRWSLDRIEDAQHGATLDRLEEAISKYEQFLADVGNLDQQISALARRRR